MYRHLTLLTLLPLLLSACASMERSGPPAPIVDAQDAPRSAPEPVADRPEPKPEAPPAPAPTRVYAYTPPEEIRETQEPATTASTPPSTPTTASTPAPSATAESPRTAARETSAPQAPSQAPTQPPPQQPRQQPPAQPSSPPQTAQTPPPPAATPEPDPPASTPAPPAPEIASAAPQPGGLAPAGMPPAVASLAQRAEQQRQAGDSGGAAATLERALRIQPQEAYLWNRLARVRLEQGMSDSAAKLASRSNALTGDQPALKTNNWEIIATARRQAGDIEGAVEAERKATGG